MPIRFGQCLCDIGGQQSEIDVFRSLRPRHGIRYTTWWGGVDGKIGDVLKFGDP